MKRRKTPAKKAYFPSFFFAGSSRCGRRQIRTKKPCMRTRKSFLPLLGTNVSLAQAHSFPRLVMAESQEMAGQEQPEALQRSICSAETLVGGLNGLHLQPSLLLAKTEHDEDLRAELHVAWATGFASVPVASACEDLQVEAAEIEELRRSRGLHDMHEVENQLCDPYLYPSPAKVSASDADVQMSPLATPLVRKSFTRLRTRRCQTRSTQSL